MTRPYTYVLPYIHNEQATQNMLQQQQTRNVHEECRKARRNLPRGMYFLAQSRLRLWLIAQETTREKLERTSIENCMPAAFWFLHMRCSPLSFKSTPENRTEMCIAGRSGDAALEMPRRMGDVTVRYASNGEVENVKLSGRGHGTWRERGKDHTQY